MNNDRLKILCLFIGLISLCGLAYGSKKPRARDIGILSGARPVNITPLPMYPVWKWVTALLSAAQAKTK